VGFLLGWTGRGWWIAEDDERSVRQRYRNTRRVMWGRRQAMVWAGLVLWATALAYVFGQGR
jgi:hypothetical protein